MRKYLRFGLLICVILVAFINGNQNSTVFAATTDVQAIKKGEIVYYKNVFSLLYDELNEGVTLTKKVQDYNTKKWVALDSVTIVKINNSKNIYFSTDADADKYINAYKNKKKETLIKVELNTIKTSAQEKYNKEAPSIVLKASTTEPTTTDVTVNVDVTDNKEVTLKKWAIGTKPANKFSIVGTTLTDNSFTVSKNGTYTVYALDNDGNKRTKSVTISNIDKTEPAITLSIPESDVTAVSKKIQVSTTDDTGVQDQKWAYGNKGVEYFVDKGSRIAPLQNANQKDKIIALKNGVYTVYAEDKLGNKAVKTITIDGISEFTEVTQTGVQCEVCRMDLYNTDPNKVHSAKAIDQEGITHYFCRIGCMYHQEHANSTAFTNKYVRDYSATAPRLNNWIAVENAVTVKFKNGETAKGIMGWNLFHFPDLPGAANYLGVSKENVVAEKLENIIEYTKTNNKGMNYQYEVDKAAQ
jgi:hypothetical protein